MNTFALLFIFKKIYITHCYFFSRLMPVANGYRGPVKSTSTSTKIFAPPAAPILVKLPKRMKFIYFWARTRMVQRGLMVSFLNFTFNLLEGGVYFCMLFQLHLNFIFHFKHCNHVDAQFAFYRILCYRSKSMFHVLIIITEIISLYTCKF